MPTGIYQGGMDIGGYLSFTAIGLAFEKGADRMLNADFNKTKEVIWIR